MRTANKSAGEKTKAVIRQTALELFRGHGFEVTTMRDIAAAFRAGDFAKPFEVHAQRVPGTQVMTARRDKISYEVKDRPRGGEVRIRSDDPRAIAAIHEFLAFQRKAHHAAGHEMR